MSLVDKISAESLIAALDDAFILEANHPGSVRLSPENARIAYYCCLQVLADLNAK